MRVYLPATVTMLRQLLSTAELPATSAWTASETSTEDASELEEREYAAFTAAAQASLALLRAHPSAPRRRVVVSADMADSTVREATDHGPGEVTVDRPVALAVVAAVHADDPSTGALVAAATNGDSAAAERLANLPMQWWARQEIAELL
jgi:hypothetical protein